MMKWLSILILIALLSVAAAGALVWTWLDAKPTTGASSTTERLVAIPRGSSTKSISRRLADAGLLEHPQLWAGSARALGLSQDFRAGEYAFVGGESPRELMLRLVAGEVTAYQVGLVEGWTLQQALTLLQGAPKLNWDLEGADSESLFGLLQERLSAERYLALSTSEVFVGATLKGAAAGFEHTAAGAEGWLFPDTYSYTAGSNASDLVARAWQQMQTQLLKAWESKSAKLPYANAAELLTMASIVEKETGQAADREIIAQVFVRRLQIGMRLQTDPTVIYGLGTAFDGDLKRIHLRTDTPYNSYTRHGLPPTAIALPGSAALKAAAHPAAGEFLYFVARGDGSSQFSKTLGDHEAAVQRYQRQGRPKRSAKQAATTGQGISK